MPKTLALNAPSTSSLPFILVVIEAFDRYRRGDHITDPNKIQAVLTSPQAGSVQKIAVSSS